MSDVLNNLRNVVQRAEYGVDPIWLEIAITEIEQLRVMVHALCDADLGIYVCSCDYLECVCEDDAYRNAFAALHEAAERWDTEGPNT